MALRGRVVGVQRLNVQQHSGPADVLILLYISGKRVAADKPRGDLHNNVVGEPGARFLKTS